MNELLVGTILLEGGFILGVIIGHEIRRPQVRRLENLLEAFA